jgi:hypothetical protein
MPIPKPNASESQNDYVGRCMHEIASEYDTNEQSVAICINTYEKGNMNKTSENRVASKLAGIKLVYAAKESDKMAEDTKSLPWEDCIAKMMDEYGDKDIAEKVCGMIKSKYGS